MYPEFHQTPFAIARIEMKHSADECRGHKESDANAEPLIYSCHVHHDKKDEYPQQSSGEKE